MRQRTGYVYQDKKTRCWIARTTITDESGRRRNVKRHANSKSAARLALKSVVRAIEDEGSHTIDTVRMTFNDLADYYEKPSTKLPLICKQRKGKRLLFRFPFRCIQVQIIFFLAFVNDEVKCSEWRMVCR
jgi:hypothetical protein